MQSPDHPAGGRPKYHFFLDGTQVEVESSSITGATVRAHLGGDKSGYAIFLEGQGNDEDRQITDAESFNLEKRPPRFYSVPPATFGSR